MGDGMDKKAWDEASTEIVNAKPVGARVDVKVEYADGTSVSGWVRRSRTVGGLSRSEVTIETDDGGHQIDWASATSVEVTTPSGTTAFGSP